MYQGQKPKRETWVKKKRKGHVRKEKSVTNLIWQDRGQSRSLSILKWLETLVEGSIGKMIDLLAYDC